MSNTLIGDVSDTAYWIAHLRSVETQRPDALFRDPLAGLLAGDRGKDIANSMPRPYATGWAIVMRTCIIDDFIRQAIREGVDVVLNLGAGLDTRPYRMDLPASLTWIEADYPHVIEYKQQRLSGEKPRCHLTRAKCDLADDTARRRLLADANARGKKLLVLTEGVVPYLSNEEASSLACDLRKLDQVRYWLVDYFSPELLKLRERRIGDRMQNAPFKFAPSDWFGFFEERGWRLKETRYLTDEAHRLGRRIELPVLVTIVTKVRQMFMPKGRRETFRKFAGYIMLEADVPTARVFDVKTAS